MGQKNRLDDIINILKKNGYVTVKYLTEELHYSTATINRDLNLLQKQRLVVRHYGGAELSQSSGTQLVFRYHKMRPVKNRIGKKAAEYICDGDTVFIDGSTTAQYIGQYITQRKNLTVISNNMALLTFLSEYGVNCICLGGRVIEIPSMLCGPETAGNVRKYRADKMFFSTAGVYDDGKIGTTLTYYEMHRAMAENSREVFFLADHGKLNLQTPMVLFDFARVNRVICDIDFPYETVSKYKSVEFIKP